MWKCAHIDSFVLKEGQNNYSLYNNRTPGADDILDQEEPDLVLFIQKNKSLLHLLLQESGIERYRVSIPNLEREYLDPMRKSGDLDLIVAGPNIPPDLAIFEFKRIKLKALDDLSDKINKMGDLYKLVAQAKERMALGFRMNMAVTLIHSDLGSRNSPNTNMRGYALSSQNTIWEQIKAIIPKLPSEVGVILARFDYPTTESHRFNFCVNLLRSPSPVKQSPQLTDRFIDLMNSRLAGNFA